MAASVKTAISMQKELLVEVNRLAGELNVSRSRLFVLAVQDFIKKQESKKMLARINGAFSDFPDAEEKTVQSGMRRRLIDNHGDESW